uniref:ubinuclein-1-like n=1 Tax=Scatophagus argus TaxID=75038 RepID=UPI001ED7ED64|nr:ubinuclein-1-like [Scatophagus argus]
MAESRRIQFTTLSSDVPSSFDKPAAVRKSPPDVVQVKETRPDQPADPDTVRLVLTLFEPDDRSFPEFSYGQLVDNKIHHANGEVPLSRFEEDEVEDEVLAIAKKLEEKYGGKPKKKKDRIQDLIDIGYGYDDEDSFIDNSEAYDEFVPASITTKLGGFYVNSGVLQFRQASDTEDLATEEKTPEASKKRKLSLGQSKPKKKSCREDGELKHRDDLKSSILPELGPADELMKKKKKKKAAGTLSVTSMLKKFQREKEKERQKVEKANQTAAAITGASKIPLCPADAAGGGGSGVADPLLTLIGSTNDYALIQAASTVDFDIDLDCLLDASEGTLSPKLLPEPAGETQRFVPETDDHTQAQTANPNASSQLKPHSEQIQVLSQGGSTSPQHFVPLPEGLPSGLEDSIRKLMAAAKTSEGESKLKFFTPEINSILLDIELQCREQGAQLRSKVYTHLSSFLPCSRDTLLKRVKKLLLAHMEEAPDVEDPMRKLKEAIGKAMPEQIARFHDKCQMVKTSQPTEEDKEGKHKVNAGPETSVEEKGGKRGGPKKLFRWNEEIRECLCQVIKVKMEKYEKGRKGSQELEEYLKTLLDNEVKPLWPKGWMQSRVLMRESRNILSLFTSFSVKKGRPEKKPPSISGPPATSDDCSTLQGSPPEKGSPSEADSVFMEVSGISNSVSLGAVKKEVTALKKEEGKTGGRVALGAGASTPAGSDKPQASLTPESTHLLPNILADEALPREGPFSISHELLAAAVAKYKHSVQHWSFVADTESPPLPPPPPQSSPVGFPVSGLHQVVLPQLLQIGDFARHISDDADITIQ